jgi:SAM-dependent methyltransferase
MNVDNLISIGYDPQYHDRQFMEPYQSTISFCDWLIRLGAISGKYAKICDVGCGKGANLYYMSKKFPDCVFIGIDIDEQLIREGNDFLKLSNVNNCQLKAGDLYKVGSYFGSKEFDGVISLQTLSWLDGYKDAIDSIASLTPKWIALTSLFYDGPIEAKTIITQYDDEKIDNSFFYNTYSLPIVRQYLYEHGYKKFECKRFEIPIDIPQNSERKMGTYTELTTDGRRLQISGPLLMSWYFIYAVKS